MVAKVFGVTPTTTGYWMRGYTTMDEKNAERAAEMLNLDLDFVMLSLEAERKNKSGLEKIAAIFERAAVASQHHAASIFIGVFALSTLSPLAAELAREVCILCKTCSYFFKGHAPRFRPA